MVKSTLSFTLLWVLQLFLLAITPQAICSHNSDFTFNISQVTQCEPVSIDFSGKLERSNIPRTLALIPANAQPVFIHLPPISEDARGFNVTFFPFPADTVFLASLDGERGRSVAPVSNFLSVSPSDNVSCLPTSTLPSPDIFQFGESNVSACGSFFITYNGSRIVDTPRVRLYEPGQHSTHLDLATDQFGLGNTSYILPSVLNKFILSIHADGEFRQTSGVQGANGVPSNVTECGYVYGTTSVQMSTPDSRSTNTRSTRLPIIIGLTVGAVVLLLIAIPMIIFVYRERKRNRESGILFTPATMIDSSHEKIEPRQAPTDPNLLEKAVENPPYVRGGALFFSQRSTSMQSKSNLPSQGMDSSGSVEDPVEKGAIQNVEKRTDNDVVRHVSLNSLDIEGMLDMARFGSYQSDRVHLSRQSFPQSLSTTIVHDPDYDALPDISPTDYHSLLRTLESFPDPVLRRQTPLDVPEDPRLTRFSFASSSALISCGSNNRRHIASLPFVGLEDDADSESDLIEGFAPLKPPGLDLEKKFVKARKKVSFADEVRSRGERNFVKSTKEQRLFGLPATPKSRAHFPIMKGAREQPVPKYARRTEDSDPGSDVDG
ncbi:hypothetical protein AX17_005193 [Amanita inopinata Kibby_2008]|nr:hypothetical protein AX17_005193 [Amanita inopinata Kibby_2008]